MLVSVTQAGQASGMQVSYVWLHVQPLKPGSTNTVGRRALARWKRGERAFPASQSCTSLVAQLKSISSPWVKLTSVDAAVAELGGPPPGSQPHAAAALGCRDPVRTRGAALGSAARLPPVWLAELCSTAYQATKQDDFSTGLAR
jgi:hypothetical protein